MDVTLAEFAETAQPAISAKHAGVLVVIAEIPETGLRKTGHRGRPARTYSHAALRSALAAESERTSRPFRDNDWIAAALLGRRKVRADPIAGEIWWPDGTRAETLGTGNYGWNSAGTIAAPTLT